MRRLSQGERHRDGDEHRHGISHTQPGREAPLLRGLDGLLIESEDGIERPNDFHQLTPDGTSIRDQVEAIATKVYGADGVDFRPAAEKDLARMDRLGFGTMPVCMAKTHLSLTHDPTMLNRPTGWRLPVRGLVPSAGAGFVVVLCGDMQRMPGLGRTPAFKNIDVDEQGRTVGLF